jgi:hypothetical protein
LYKLPSHGNVLHGNIEIFALVAHTIRLLSKNLKIKIYRTINLPVILYGCEAWLLILREERRMVFENRVLRRVFGPKRDKVTEEWRKIHNEELNDLYFLPNIVRVVKSRIMRWVGHVARMGEGRGNELSGSINAGNFLTNCKTS